MYQPKPTDGDTAWFVQDRFGLFIHWGLYALPARHEWVRNKEQITNAAYQKYFDHFDPDLYDPRAWARAAREAGMKYFVITTKHHEGFCLWDTKFTDYKSTNTPCGRDLLREMVDAFRAEGLKVGFYYSIIDWHHEHFPIDVFHPLRDREDAAELNKSRDVSIYAEYMRNQVRELLTEFGKIDILWFDFSYPNAEYKGLPGKGRDDWESEKLLALVRELQPKIIVNNRIDLPGAVADVHTPEQYQPTDWVKVDGEPVVWEACQTLSGSWGYHRDESSFKSAHQLIAMLINTVATGGNLLMNVGPTGRGYFDDRALASLQTYADWMKLHSRSIYGCTQSKFKEAHGCRYTQNGNRLYVHVLDWPFHQLHLPGLAGQVEYAQLLNDCSELQMAVIDPADAHSMITAPTPDMALTIGLPVQKPNVAVPVIELFLKR